MERTDAKAINAALEINAVPASAAVTGIVALCRELEQAGVLSPDAVDRVSEAMVNDITEARVDYMAKSRIAGIVRAAFERPTSPEAEPE